MEKLKRFEIPQGKVQLDKERKKMKFKSMK